MKRLVYLKTTILFLIIFNQYHSNAQLKADAGEDLIICNLDEDQFLLGGSPTGTGGIEPYIYSWSGEFSVTETSNNNKLTATSILDDTTKSNPVVKLQNVPEKWYTLFLKIEDSAGKIAYDTMNIVNAAIWIHPIYIEPDTILKGDSIQFFGDPYFRNDFLPISYSIWPNKGLSDTTDIFGWAKPETSTTYYIQAMNSIGCVSAKIPYWNIEVIDTITNSILLPSIINNDIKFFPNPTKNMLNIFNPTDIMIKTIELIDVSGRTIQYWDKFQFDNNFLQIDTNLSGIYIIKVETEFGFKTEKLVFQN